ncbi:MAG: IS110 family transposase [Bacilli bacterium]
MLKIVHKTCAGIDVHKRNIVVTIAKTDDNNFTTYSTKTFLTFTEDLKSCKYWLIENECLEVCMESTGKYWIPIFNILENSCNCIITHPKYVRSLPGKKTDKKDSIWIADMFKHGLVEPSFMPPLDIRQLRDLMRYRMKLIYSKSSEKNRFQNSLTVSNVQIANVVTDVFGKTSQSILKLMLEKPELTLDDITPLLKKNLKSTPEDILKSIDGDFSESQTAKMNVCLKHYDSVLDCIDTLEEEILKLSINYKTEINLITTCPGIKEISAIFILAEIGSNMNTFANSEHLCSWAGLTPRCNESAKKKKSVRINKAGIYIKPLLVQCALAAIKDKSCPYIQSRYNSIKSRRGHKKAIIAIARLLLTSIYHMLLTGEVFDYNRFDKLLERNFKTKSKEVSTSDMISKLESLGYVVSTS